MVNATDDRQYDLFVSYKSDNVDVARAVTEALLASDVRVWFAEYEVVLDNYNNFQKSIDLGIDSSRYALIFTNRDWATSKYCQLEIDRIVQRIPHEAILQVCIPRHPEPFDRTPVLADVPTMDFDGNIDSVLTFIAQHTGLNKGIRLSTDSWFNPESQRLILPDRISICSGPLERTEIDTAGTRLHEFRPGTSHHFEGTIYDEEIHLLLTRYPVARHVAEVGNRRDDREIYAANREIAKDQLQRIDAEQQGLHLVRWNNAMQFAVTFGPWEYPDGRQGWERLFVLKVPPDYGNTYSEIVVSFFVAFRKRPAGTGLNALCVFTPFFDALVATIRHETEDSLPTDQAVLRRSTTMAAFSTLVRVSWSTFLLPVPIYRLLGTDVFQALFPARVVPSYRRFPLSRLQEEFGLFDRFGWVFLVFYFFGLIGIWYEFQETLRTPKGIATILWPDPISVFLAVSLASCAIASSAARVQITLLLRKNRERYFEYQNRKVGGFNVLRAMWATSAMLAIAAALLGLSTLNAYLRIDNNGIHGFRWGMPIHCKYSQVNRILSCRSAVLPNSAPTLVIECGDGFVWRTDAGYRVSEHELEEQAVQTISERSGKPIEIVDTLPQ